MNDETRDGAEAGIPPAVAAAWGIQDRPGKGPKRGLSVRRIVHAAIRTALEDGLGAVSMNRVAGRLGTAAMSLYRYVSAKDELLALMVDEVQAAAPDPPDADAGWRVGMTHWARVNRDIYKAHPWLVHVPIMGPPIMPNSVAMFERLLRSLAGTGLAEEEKVSVVLLITGLVRNQATLEAQLQAAMRSPGPEQVSGGYGRLLAELIDAEDFPALHAAVTAGVFDEGDTDVEDDMELEFNFSLERVLDGIEVFIAERATAES